MTFTERQRGAIDIGQLGRNACIVAGPGSGKTAVLVERYRQLVESGIPPHRILAITFTEKAAANMKQRLAAQLTTPHLRRQLENAYVSTVHGFCLRLLRENAINAGVDPRFEILDPRVGAILQTQCAAQALDEMLRDHPERTLGLMRNLARPDLDLPGLYDAIRSAGIPAARLREFPVPKAATLEELDWAVRNYKALSQGRLTDLQRDQLDCVLEWNTRMQEARNCPDVRRLLEMCHNNPMLLNRAKPGPIREALREAKETIEPSLRRGLLTRFMASHRETLIETLERFDRLFSECKRERGALDFADLEFFAVRLLEEHPEVRARIQAQFDQVMMDEFQDTNGQQARLLGLLRAPDNFFAVGDINQSIFGFRHASPSVFRDYRDRVRDRQEHYVELLENWRSHPDILLAVETVCQPGGGIEHRELIAARSFPASEEPCVEAIVSVAADLEAAMANEAEWVARRILELRRKLGLTFGDFAVLVRNSEVIETFARAFDRHGVEHIWSRRKGFLEAREVLDLVHLLGAIANPRDEAATLALLRSPLVSLSDEAVLRLKLPPGSNLGAALMEERDLTAFDPLDREKLRLFQARLFRWRNEQGHVSLDRLLLRALDECGYRWVAGTRAGANIEKFLGMARRVPPRTSLAEFLEQLRLMRNADAREMDAPLDDSIDAVRVLTAHSAKGLEFPVVFLPAMHKGVDPNKPCLSFTPEFGLGVRWNEPVTGASKGDLFQKLNETHIGRKESEESERLLYVAMTRAERRLVLSWSSDGTPPKNWAAVVSDRLGLAGVTGSETLRVAAPGGKELTVRLDLVDAPPEPLERAWLDRPAPDVQVLAKPEPGDQHDTNVNVTSLALFADCPRKYYLGRYLGFEGRQARRGNGSHRHGGELDSSEVGKQVHALLAQQPVENPEFETLHLARTFEKSLLGRRAARSRKAEREFAFLLAVEDVVISGTIDLWFEDRGELILVDYKTDDVSPGEARDHAQAYALQLALYAMAIERVTGRLPDHVFIYLLRPDVVVEIPLTAGALDEVRQIVRKLKQAQAKLEFPLREGDRCRRCQFYMGLCPASYAISEARNSSTDFIKLLT